MDQKSLSLVICLSIFMGILVLVTLHLCVENVWACISKRFNRLQQIAHARMIQDIENKDVPIVMAVPK